MCIGVPMKIIENRLGTAICDHKGEHIEIDNMLIGEQPVGTWVLVFINAAREILKEEEALKINSALEALEKVMSGDAEIDHLFADLVTAETTTDR